MVNFASQATTIACDASCLSKLGFSGQVKVRDLWLHQDLPGTVSIVQQMVQGNGASVTLKITAA